MPASRLYYHFKPYLPWRFRMALRRAVASRRRQKYKDIWPINEAAGRPPEGWSGWPQKQKFSFVLTHDVEGPEGLAKCHQLMELEQQMGFRSSFNFIPEGDYAISKKLREDLLENGFEVGVHDLHHDGRLFWTQPDFSENAKWINYYLKEWGAKGFRSAFMLRNLDWLHELDIQYDASTFDTDPFEPQPDGVGTIFPFWVVRPNSKTSPRRDLFIARDRATFDSTYLNPRPGSGRAASREGYVELPYTLPQDFTLFLSLRESTPEIWLRKLDWIARHGGMALVNVHPDYLRFPGELASPRTFPLEHYVQLLEHVKNRYAGYYWQPLPHEIAAWYKENFVSKNRFIGRTFRSFKGKRAAVVLFSHYPSDPRPKRAAETLMQQGVEIDFLCLQGDKAEPKHEIVDGLNVFRISIERRRGNKIGYLLQYSLFISIAFWFLARRSMRKQYDLVHVHNMPDILVFCAWVPKLLGAKVILDLHDPMPELMETIFNLSPQSFAVRFLKRCEKWSIRFADLVLTPNIAFKSLFTSRGCPQEKIHIVMNSPNEEVFRFREAKTAPLIKRDLGESFTILYHGSLVARHGLDFAIDALEIVKKSIPNVVIVICGESNAYFEHVLNIIRQRGLNESVRYLGRRNHCQIVEAIEQCDIGLIPNRRSAFTEINMPTRIFEYLALGKPVIVPRTQGIRDYFTDESILFFEPDNMKDLADKIAWAYHHPLEMEASAKCGQAIYQKHRWSGEQKHLIALMTGLLGRTSEYQEVGHRDEEHDKLLSPTPLNSEILVAASREAAISKQ